MYKKRLKKLQYETRVINEDYETGYYNEREYLRIMKIKTKHLNRTIETIGVLEKKRKQDELITLNDYHIKLWMQKNIAIITVKLKDKSIISVETY